MILGIMTALVWVAAVALWIMYGIERSKSNAKESLIETMREIDASKTKRLDELQLEIKANRLKYDGKLAEMRKRVATFANDFASEG